MYYTFPAFPWQLGTLNFFFTFCHFYFLFWKILLIFSPKVLIGWLTVSFMYSTNSLPVTCIFSNFFIHFLGCLFISMDVPFLQMSFSISCSPTSQFSELFPEPLVASRKPYPCLHLEVLAPEFSSGCFRISAIIKLSPIWKDFMQSAKQKSKLLFPFMNA